MSEAEVINPEATTLLLDRALEHPDPDPDDLPEPIPGWLPADERACTHLVRAILRHEDVSLKLRAAWKREQEAWLHLVGAAEARGKALRLCVQAFMERKGLPKLQTPWFTASISKGRMHVEIMNEAAAIAVCKALGAGAVIRVRESLDKKELEAVYTATPGAFKGCAKIVTGEPGLRIMRRE